MNHTCTRCALSLVCRGSSIDDIAVCGNNNRVIVMYTGKIETITAGGRSAWPYWDTQPRPAGACDIVRKCQSYIPVDDSDTSSLCACIQTECAYGLKKDNP
jgi:hypothetical protein